MSEVAMSVQIQVSETKEEMWDSLMTKLIAHKLIGVDEATSFMEEDSEKEIELEAFYEGTIVPFSPSTLEDPPEGGYCEDDAVIVTTNNEIFRSRAKKYKAIASRIAFYLSNETEVFFRSEEKAKRLGKLLERKAQSLSELDITEHLNSSELDKLSTQAYEQYIDD